MESFEARGRNWRNALERDDVKKHALGIAAKVAAAATMAGAIVGADKLWQAAGHADQKIFTAQSAANIFDPSIKVYDPEIFNKTNHSVQRIEDLQKDVAPKQSQTTATFSNAVTYINNLPAAEQTAIAGSLICDGARNNNSELIAQVLAHVPRARAMRFVSDNVSNPISLSELLTTGSMDTIGKTNIFIIPQWERADVDALMTRANELQKQNPPTSARGR